ncbi:MAG TPA: SRPBCC family protein [Pseudonocardiaceae bacterium]|jgi:carbon monoxide dehydrogenase subunit G|nr:SRPBCC family protein [Pseudonocardiaceae bacterium]
MRLEETADTSAGPQQVWSALTNVEGWPTWIPSTTSVTLLGPGPLRVGSRARVKQLGTPPIVWQVSEIRQPDGFSWVARTPGLQMVGQHWATSNPDGTIRITVTLDQSGPLAGLVNFLTGRRSARYVKQEAAGMKAASEA